MRLEIRLYAHQVFTNTRSRTEVILRSSEWLMCSELCWFAYSLISKLKRRWSDLKKIQMFFFWRCKKKTTFADSFIVFHDDVSWYRGIIFQVSHRNLLSCIFIWLLYKISFVEQFSFIEVYRILFEIFVCLTEFANQIWCGKLFPVVSCNELCFLSQELPLWSVNEWYSETLL